MKELVHLKKLLPVPKPTLADEICQSALPQHVKELDLNLVAGTDDFDNATCGFGPDSDGNVYVAKHSRHLDGLYHSCSCSIRHFRLPPPRPLPNPQDFARCDFGRPDFLQQWMRYMMPSIGHLTLWDLCLPGTHDTLTYDLGLRPAVGDTIPNLGPLEMEPFSRLPMAEVRKVCACQTIDVERQLGAGIRFLDVRVIYSRGRWVGVHGLETEKEALFYLEQVCAWLRDHRDEIVVLWLSRHGNETHTGHEQYPNASADKKQEFYEQILHTFGDLVVDHQATPLDRAPLRDLVARGKRAVLICSDWAEFTQQSSKALDAAQVIENHLPGAFNDPVLDGLEFFSNLRLRDDKYHIVSLANSADKGAFVQQVVSKLGRDIIGFCGGRLPKSKFEDVPGMESNPWRLDHSARFTNYYAQTLLEIVWKRCALPRAIYIDMVTEDGGIEIGNDQKFGYVDTILAYNALQSRDQDLVAKMMARLDLLPPRTWEDRRNGRSAVWPLKSMA